MDPTIDGVLDDCPVFVNGMEIPVPSILREMQYHPAASRREAYRQAAFALLIRELLLQEARRLGVEADAEEDGDTPEDALIGALMDREVAVPEADQASCRTYFENNRDRFRSPDLLEARHILLAAPQEDAEARAEAGKRAREVLEALEQGAAFEALAEKLSSCPSRESGGCLGQLSPGQTVPEFERQVFALPEGLAPHPIETRYGYHVVRVDRRVRGRLLEFEQVESRIREYLESRVYRKAVSQYIEQLIARADIRGIDLDDNDSPLVQ